MLHTACQDRSVFWIAGVFFCAHLFSDTRIFRVFAKKEDLAFVEYNKDFFLMKIIIDILHHSDICLYQEMRTFSFAGRNYGCNDFGCGKTVWVF